MDEDRPNSGGGDDEDGATEVFIPHERRRVKVYEMRNEDWHDRGTGFCACRIAPTHTGEQEVLLFVEAEGQPGSLLLENIVQRKRIYKKQQTTLIVWTQQVGEHAEVEMALSFQEPEGCDAIWEILHNVQGDQEEHDEQYQHIDADDIVSEEGTAAPHSGSAWLPPPEIGNLEDVEKALRAITSTNAGRNTLARFIIQQNYIEKLVPLVETAEDLESLHDLHLLCSIMKMLILLNDSTIIDHIVTEPIIFGVIGALEYDPGFPRHKANHREYIRDRSRYKKVIEITDPAITSKIHATWRLTYLKDVVLARILDDPTFGILNSLIFFNQVDIITYLQDTPQCIRELFSIILSSASDAKRKKDAMGFLQSCCTVAKSLQAMARTNLYNVFLDNGLLRTTDIAISQPEKSIRIAGVEILSAIIDHDPSVVRAYILKICHEKEQSSSAFHHTLIKLFIHEDDLGVKIQIADAFKVLLDPAPTAAQIQQAQQAQQKQQSQQQGASEHNAGGPSMAARVHVPPDPHTEAFISQFFQSLASQLFQPLIDLETHADMTKLSINDVQLFSHLVDIMIYLTRVHQPRSRIFFLSWNLIQRISHLFNAPMKHLNLSAVKFLRCCISLGDDAYIAHFLEKDLFAPILRILSESLPRDNLLNSACLELFECARHQGIKPIIKHLATKHQQTIQSLAVHVDLFQQILDHEARLQEPPPTMATDSQSPLESSNQSLEPKNFSGGRWQGIQEMDLAEQAYFDASDDEEEEQEQQQQQQQQAQDPTHVRPSLEVDDNSPQDNGIRPVSQSAILCSQPMPRLEPSPLVDYPEDDDDDDEDAALIGPVLPPSSSNETSKFPNASQLLHTSSTLAQATKSEIKGEQHSPTQNHRLSLSPMLPSLSLERIAEKRRRAAADEEDDDEICKLANNPVKRRSSSVSSSTSQSMNGPILSAANETKGPPTANQDPADPLHDATLDVNGAIPTSQHKEAIPQSHPHLDSSKKMTISLGTNSTKKS